MKPSLEHILEAAINTTGIEIADWVRCHGSRHSSIIRVKGLFFLLAFEEGYTQGEIAEFIGQHRTTVLHHIHKFKDHCNLYPDCGRLLEKAKSLIPRGPKYTETVCTTAWLARCRNGLLVISSNKPIEISGFWISEGVRPFYPQNSFQQITYEKGPSKVSIQVTLEENEKV